MEPDHALAELTVTSRPGGGDADQIYVDSFLSKFPKLLRSGQLAVIVQKEISRTLVTCESRDVGGYFSKREEYRAWSEFGITVEIFNHRKRDTHSISIFGRG